MGKQNVEGAVRVCSEGLLRFGLAQRGELVEPPEPFDKLTAPTAEVGQGPEPAEGPDRGRERDGCGPRGDSAPARRGAPGPREQGFLDCFKETLGATEAQWKVVEPQLAKVMALSRATGVRPRPGFDPGGRRGGPDAGHGPEVRGPQPMSELAKATEALETALDDPQTPAEEILGALKVLREAQWRGKRQLSEARAVLLGLVAPRQEAQLVLMGILD